MRWFQYLLPLALIAVLATTSGAQATREPHIGYLFPAGGQQGSVFEIAVSGQFLRGVNDIYVSGQGVHVSIVKHYRLRRNIPQEQRQALRKRLAELTDKRLAELPPEVRASFPAARRPDGRRPAMRSDADKQEPKAMEPVELPDHPLLRDLESKSLRELKHVADQLLNFKNLRKRQINVQLSEVVLIEVTIDPGTEPGDRELRLRTPRGLTNPMCFQVGLLPEVREQEPNDPTGAPDLLPADPPVDLPAVFNGQILPGDVDRLRFRAKRGQQLVIEASARRLVPFLADAVPGWFQATLALYDAKGNEVAFADDYRFRPDPVVFYEVPENGEYELEIRDSIYRGREDFVYRIAVGELPFITQVFPLGGKTGVRTTASIDGWNLPAKRMPLDTMAGDDRIRTTAVRYRKAVSNEVTYAVDSLPESSEAEPNDDREEAQRIALPRIVNGRIDRPGDVDVFRFHGRAGDEVVAEVLGRRLNSPLDSLLRVTDSSGKVLAWNDDHVQKDGHLHTDIGFRTHHADSYLHATLPEDGTYYVHLTDAQNHGDKAHAYRLRISEPRPDFSLSITPSSLNTLSGRVVPIAVHALRKDGFAGVIEIVVKEAPAGFSLDGGRIPAGSDGVRMTLRAPKDPSDRPMALQFEGRAVVDGKTIVRPVVPSEDVMQAFLWRHLTPTQEFIATVKTVKWNPNPVELTGDVPIRVAAGGTARVQFKTQRRLRIRKIELELSEPPDGVAIQDVRVALDGLTFELHADGIAAKPGFADNLIVEAFTEIVPRQNNKQADKGKAPPEKRRVSLGILPAVPFVVVE